MEERKWDKLERDCLIEIFMLVGIESLVFSIPKVCKSWYDASLDSTCWRNLKFPELMVGSEPNTLMFEFIYRHGHSSLNAFIKYAIDYRKTFVVSLQLPSYCDKSTFELASNKCPNLRTLDLPYSLVHNHGGVVVQSVRNWKALEEFTVRDGYMLFEILKEIKDYCPMFTTLNCSAFKFGNKEASAIVEVEPKLKKLCIEYCWLRMENVVSIMKSCKTIEEVDVSKCFLV